ncbi:unnamed protein product [Ambrosiozyma monospora]|uniref:Unnamed protein product n=1 Tax=Ambrosiozyma monospora TaxID=43982 RepID=A0A9W6TC68_AMBMO|nr:unnamed protein product [Ambrosiozyma monospora]
MGRGYEILQRIGSHFSMFCGSTENIKSAIKYSYPKNHSVLDHYGINRMNLSIMANWKYSYRNMRSDGVTRLVGISNETDMDILKELLSTGIEKFYTIDGITMSFKLDESVKTHCFDYDLDNKSNGGLGSAGFIMGSISSLAGLKKQFIWTVDTTFDTVVYKGVKLITVCYKDPVKRKIHLGCVATLPATERSVHFAKFFAELLKLLEISTGDSNLCHLELVVTDDSEAEATGINTALKNNNVLVVNCLWHRHVSIEGNLDTTGVRVMMKAFYSLDTEKANAFVRGLWAHYAAVINYLKGMISRNLYKKRKYIIRSYHRINNKTTTEIRSQVYTIKQAAEMYEKMLGYVESLAKGATKWSLAYRIKSFGTKLDESGDKGITDEQKKRLAQLAVKVENLKDVHGGESLWRM